jgi:ketosteroid isomerase-like protein
MNNSAWLQQLLDQAFATLDFRDLTAHLAEDVVFEVTPPEGGDPVSEGSGRRAVVDYFTSLGDIVTFWRVRCYGDGDRVVALGVETFTIPRYGITLGTQFALLVHLCDRLITHFLIIENLSESSPAFEETALEEAQVQ